MRLTSLSRGNHQSGKSLSRGNSGTTVTYSALYWAWSTVWYVVDIHDVMGNWFYYRLQEIPFYFIQNRNGGLTIIDTDFYTSLTRESMYVSHNTEARSRNHFCHGQVIILHMLCVCVCVCVCAFVFLPHLTGMQSASSLGSIIFSSATCLALTYCSTLSYKWHDFRKKVIGGKMHVFISSTTVPPIFLILRKIRRDIIINVHTYSRKILVILVMF
jgi:hypothetical protein